MNGVCGCNIKIFRAGSWYVNAYKNINDFKLKK